MSSMNTKSIKEQIILARQAWGGGSRKYRNGKRRTIKRLEQGAAAKDIHSQLADTQAELDEREIALFMAPRPGELLDSLLDDLRSNSYDFDVDISMNTTNSPDPAQIETAVYVDMMATQSVRCPEWQVDLGMYRHASHLPDNHDHIGEVTDMITLVTTISDQPEPDVILPDTHGMVGLRLGGRLSRSGNVYGKIRHSDLQPPDLDASDFADVCENMIEMQAA